MDDEERMKQNLNKCREVDNQRRRNGCVFSLGPGDKGYLPPVTEFVTVQFHNGLLVIPVEDFKKLSKAKQKKLTKW